MSYVQLVKPNTAVKSDYGWCLWHQQEVYGTPHLYPSATAAYNATQFKHTDAIPTNVAVVLWFEHWGSYGTPATWANWGHTASFVPGLGVLTSPISNNSKGYQVYPSIEALVNEINRILPKSGTKYLGWSEDLSGVRIVKEDEVIELQPPVFNADYYRQQNPDVVKANYDAAKHWLEHGIAEGRISAPNFHVKEYVENYKDLRDWLGTDYHGGLVHYFNHGINEGRFGTKALFDAAQQSSSLQAQVAELQTELTEEKAKVLTGGTFSDADRATATETNSLIKQIVEWFKSIFKVQ